jgi:hypothetical protein
MSLSLFPILLIYGYVATISRSMSKDRYFKRIILSIFSLLLGMAFEIYLKQERRFGNIVFGFLPLLHIFYYEILRVILKSIIGKYPYTPFREKIGEKVLGSDYPQNRKVKFVDYIFGFILIFFPLITVILILIVLNNNFK